MTITKLSNESFLPDLQFTKIIQQDRFSNVQQCSLKCCAFANTFPLHMAGRDTFFNCSAPKNLQFGTKSILFSLGKDRMFTVQLMISFLYFVFEGNRWQIIVVARNICTLYVVVNWLICSPLNCPCGTTSLVPLVTSSVLTVLDNLDNYRESRSCKPYPNEHHSVKQAREKCKKS